MFDHSIDDYVDFSTEARRKLADAFCVVFPHIEYEFGHILLSDYNFDSADVCIADIDEFYDLVKEKRGEVYAKAAREAALHMLHVFKIIEDAEDAMHSAIATAEKSS